MERLRIIMVIAAFYPYTGGAEKQAQKLASSLVKKNADVTVVTGRWDNNLKKIEKFKGFKIIRNFTNFYFRKKEKINTDKSFFYSGHLDRKSKIKSVKIILRKIFVRLSVYIYQVSLFFFLISQRKNYDVINVNQVLYPAFISTLCARFLKKAVIAKVGSSGFNSDINQIKKFPEGKLQLKYILKNIDRIVCTSRIMKEEFVKEGADENKIVIIRNGVNVEDFERSYERCNTMVTMGRFIKSKNIVTLINAFSRFIEATDKELKLILIGNGPERDNILNLINKLGLGDKIVLTGMVSNPEEFLKESDLFIFPSLVEGISNSLIEAMSLKLPCIVSNIPGNIEVIGDNNSNKAVKEGEFIVSECGIFFNPSDISGLVKAIKYIFNNSEVRKKIGKNSYRRILTEYNIEEVSDRYLELYREVLKK
jgi:glycosyltransferase involved in cell wall biosynthesis